MPDSALENKLRLIVRRRMRRGQRVAVAEAAGHAHPSWVTNWLKGRQKHATLDELEAMLRVLGVSITKAIEAPDASTLDWEVFGLMRQVPEERKPLAKRLIAGIAADSTSPSEQQPSPLQPARLHRGDRKGRR